MSIQRHYDGKQLSSIYINGDELKEFAKVINEIYMILTEENCDNLLKECPNVFPILDLVLEHTEI